MIRTICVFWAVVFFLSVHSQVVDDLYGTAPATERVEANAKDAKKVQQARLQALNDSVAHVRAARALKKGYWVLQADRITMGNAAYPATSLNENANFVFQQGDQAMVQVAFNGASPGLNGVGGITLDGKTSNVKLKGSLDGDLYVSFHVTGLNINADVFITVYKGGNRAQAIVVPTFDSGQMTLYGKLVPYRKQ